MNLNQPLGEQISKGPIIESIKESVSNVGDNFSAKSIGDSSSDFLQSNSIIAKFVFLILVLVVFMILMNLGIYLISYFLIPDRNPYVIKGVIDGHKKIVVTQDPKRSQSATIYRSQNEDKGAEFTWTCWLNVEELPDTGKTNHIFNKGGTGEFNGDTTNGNAPGLYLKRGIESGTGTLQINMDSTDGSTQTVDIPLIPLNRWFNIAIRLQNKLLDVYINGAIAKRTSFPALPKQNYGDIYVCHNKGFNGSLSDLRYFDSALTVFNLTNIAMAGPNLTRSEPALVDNSFDYLSSSWYK